MKNFYLLLCFLATATFSYAQELTPDMLVGEYEGTAEVLYNDTDETKLYENAKLTIKKINADSCTLILSTSSWTFEVVPFLMINDNSISVSYSSKENISNIVKTTIVENYSDNRNPFAKGNQFNIENGELTLAFIKKVTLEGGINKKTEKLLFLKMKKQ